MRVVDGIGRGWRGAITLLCALVLAVPAPGASAGPREDLEDVRRQLEETRGGLGGIDARRAVTSADLERSQARQAELHRGLQALNAELDGAQAELNGAERRLRAATTELAATEQRLEDTRARLGEAQDQFGQRVRASYMYGGGGPGAAAAVFGVEDVSRFGQAMSYLERVVAHDREQVAIVDGLERQIAAAAEELQLLRARHDRERQLAAVERDRVAGLRDEQAGLHAQVAAQAAHHQEILAALDADRSRHVALIDSLEDDSEALESELRRRAEEERRRAEEERRRAEEARRAAAAEVRRQAALRASRSTPPSPGSAEAGWHRPSDGRVSSGYGWRRHPVYGTSRMHTGTDFAAATGSSIYAATDGVVVSAGWRGGYGLAVVVDHGDGVATLYAHTSAVHVSPGQHVGRGQVIAATGCTGTCTGPHLHFEVRVNGRHRNPMGYL